MCIFIGGLRKKWKVELVGTEAIGRGIVRLRFIPLGFSNYSIYTSQIDPVLE